MKNKNKVIGIIVGAVIVAGCGFAYKHQSIDLQNTKVKLEQSIEKSTKLEEQLKQVQKENGDYVTIIEDQKEELLERDNTLDKYRRELDKLEPIVNEHKKECPTRKIKARSSSQDAPVTTSSSRGTPISMTLSFYGDGADENGGHAGITAYGQKLSAGMVASNTYPRGTQFSFNGQTFTVQDKGGSHFNSGNRLDVFVPRLSGESNSAYKKRISHYGRRTVTMYKL